jgi:hypothetical protein
MAIQDSTLTQEYLQSLFNYIDGYLYRTKTTASRAKANSVAGGINKPSGYFQIQIKNTKYKAHRLIFLYHHGYLPKIIDHIDGDKLNNKIENLREATHRQNCFNSGKRKHNTSGYKNVVWHKSAKRWVVRIFVNGKNKHFGCYFDKEIANFVAETMRYKYHKEFANNK